MQFLNRTDADLLEKKLRRGLEKRGKPNCVLYYDSAPRDYAPAAQLIAHAIGEFDEAFLFFKFAIGGDGWTEASIDDERWGSYRAWRTALGDGRRLYDAPLHRFGPDDVQLLSQTVRFALELGWDTLLAAKPGRQLAFLSHDDRLEIYRGFSGRMLARQLTGLNYWRLAAVTP